MHLMMSGDQQPRRGGGGGGHKQVGIHKKPKRRRRSSKIAKERKSRLRRMFPLSSPSWGHSLLVLVLVLAAVVHAEDSYQPTTLPNISSREGGGTGAGVEEVADTSAGGGGGPGGSGLPPRPLSSSANQQQQLKPCDRSRKVFTSPSGEISDGPTGTNYTQVKSQNETRCFLLNKIIKNSPNPTQKFYCYLCPTDDVVGDRQRSSSRDSLATSRVMLISFRVL